MEGFQFIGKVMLLSGLVGFSFTVGMWDFCKIFGWAPVNITTNVTAYEDRGAA